MYSNEFEGGFMPPPATQTADPSPSAFTKNRDIYALLPLTVNQFNKALLLNDDSVKLVGMLLNKGDSVVQISFVLDDGTGRIDCVKWVHSHEDTKEMEPFMEGMYVRVHGQFNKSPWKKHLVVFGIKPVTDFDEITHHFMESIYVHSYNTKLMKQQAGTSNQTHMPGSAVNTHAFKTASSNQFTGHYGAENGLKGIDKENYTYIRATEHGVHQEELVKQMASLWTR